MPNPVQVQPRGDEYRVPITDDVYLDFSAVHVVDKTERCVVKVYAHGMLVAMDHLNLGSDRTRKAFARTLQTHLEDHQPNDTLEEWDLAWWERILLHAAHGVIAQWQEIQDTTPLATTEPSLQPRFLLDPLVEYGGMSLLFGRQTSLKSVMALATGITVATGVPLLGKLRGTVRPVAYLDWEDRAETHIRRLRALCTGAGIAVHDVDIMHVRMRGVPLTARVAGIRRFLADHHTGFVIVDSLGMASSGGGSSGRDEMLACVAAILSFDLPVLVVHHPSKEAMGLFHAGDRTPPPLLTAWGSTYVENESRLIYATLRAASKETEPYRPVVGLVNTKASNGLLAADRAYLLDFESTWLPNGESWLRRVTIKEVEPQDYPSLQEYLR